MTEKAAVEVPSPVSGRVVSTTGQPGDMVPVGSALIVFDTGAGSSGGSTAPQAANVAPVPEKTTVSEKAPAAAAAGNGAAGGAHVAAHRGRVATSPAIRRRAHEAGVDLRKVPGSGPNGRIVRKDFEAFVQDRTTGRGHGGGAPSKPTAVHVRAPAADGVGAAGT